MREDKKNIIVEKTTGFSLLIIDYAELLETKRKYIITRQILKSGTSIGANVREAQNAESKAEKIPLEKGQEESGDEKPRFEIQIILFDHRQPQKSQVAINNILYKAGDLIEGYEILEIHQTYIRVRKKTRLPWRSYLIWTLK